MSNTRAWKTALVSTVLGGLMLFGAAGMAQARDRYEECRERIHRQEWKLEHEIERHGYYSRQAERERHRLHELREHCGHYGYHWEYHW